MAQRTLDGDGGRAEEAVRLFLLRAGYFVVRGIKLFFEREIVTDIDLWAYGVGSATHRERVVVDCKYKRERAQGFERLLCLEGMRRLANAEHSILATTDGRQTLRNLASRQQVRFFGSEKFDQFLAMLPDSRRLTEEEWLAIVIQAEDKLLDRVRERTEHAKSLMLRLDWDAANFHVEHVQGHVDDLAGRKDRSVSVRLIYLSTAFFLVTLDYALRDAAFIDAGQIRVRIEEGLRYGSRGREAAAVLLEQLGKRKRSEALRTAEKLRADIPAGFFQRHAGTDWLFRIALILDAAAYSKEFVPPPRLSADAQSALGILLDFLSVDRRLVFDVTAG
jgi:hypothetical protein